MTDPAILALFTRGRRLHLGLYPRQLDARLGLKPGTVRAVESMRPVAPESRAALLAFNELEDAA